MTDFTDSITVEMFARNDQVEEILAGIKVKSFIKLKGVTTIDRFDSELTIGSVVGIKKIADFTSSRADTSPEKRVELHCHTKMSEMDGVSDAKALIMRHLSGDISHSDHRPRGRSGIPGCSSRYLGYA